MSIRELPVRAGQGEPKYGPARYIHVRPQPAAVGFDNRSADRQSHSYSARLGGVEGLENAIEMVRIESRSGIAHGHENATGLGLLAGYQQLSWAGLERAHGFDGV